MFLEINEQISRAEHLLQQQRMETARRIELSQNQVKHVIDQVKLSERHIEEQQRTFGEAQLEYHQLWGELSRTRQIALQLHQERETYTAQLTEAANNTARWCSRPLASTNVLSSMLSSVANPLN